MWSWFVITPFSSAGRNNKTDFNSVKDTYTRYWLQLRQAVREDCLNHKPFSISERLFGIPLQISRISCSYTQPPR